MFLDTCIHISPTNDNIQFHEIFECSRVHRKGHSGFHPKLGNRYLKKFLDGKTLLYVFSDKSQVLMDVFYYIHSFDREYYMFGDVLDEDTNEIIPDVTGFYHKKVELDRHFMHLNGITNWYIKFIDQLVRHRKFPCSSLGTGSTSDGIAFHISKTPPEYWNQTCILLNLFSKDLQRHIDVPFILKSVHFDTPSRITNVVFTCSEYFKTHSTYLYPGQENLSKSGFYDKDTDFMYESIEIDFERGVVSFGDYTIAMIRDFLKARDLFVFNSYVLRKDR